MSETEVFLRYPSVVLPGYFNCAILYKGCMHGSMQPIDVKHAGCAYAHIVKNCTYGMCFVSVSISCSISIMESLTPIMVYVLLDFSTHQNSSDKCLYSCTLIASYVPDYNLFIDHLLDLSLCIQ